MREAITIKWIGAQLNFSRLPLPSMPLGNCGGSELSPWQLMNSARDRFLLLTLRAARPRADLLDWRPLMCEVPNASSSSISSGCTSIICFYCCIALRFCSSSSLAISFGKKLESQVLTTLKRNSRSMNLSVSGLLSGRYCSMLGFLQTFSYTVRTLSDAYLGTHTLLIWLLVKYFFLPARSCFKNSSLQERLSGK